MSTRSSPSSSSDHRMIATDASDGFMVSQIPSQTFGMSSAVNNDLPTLSNGISPSGMTFLSPEHFEKRPPSPSGSTATSTDHYRTFSSVFNSSTPTMIEASRDPSSEDEEMICIKLLNHLKKNSRADESYESRIGLLRKTNAAIRRILKSPATQKDGSCKLLLSAISIHLVDMCERVCHQALVPTNSFTMDKYPVSHDPSMVEQTPNAIKDQAKLAVIEATVLTSIIGALVSRPRPLSDIQSTDQRETLHLELATRLKEASLLLA